MRLGYTTARTYAEMLRQAAPFLDKGKPVMLDASYLRRELREEARAFAAQTGVRFLAVDGAWPLAEQPDHVEAFLHR
jgi:predicted kinase